MRRERMRWPPVQQEPLQPRPQEGGRNALMWTLGLPSRATNAQKGLGDDVAVARLGRPWPDVAMPSMARCGYMRESRDRFDRSAPGDDAARRSPIWPRTSLFV